MDVCIFSVFRLYILDRKTELMCLLFHIRMHMMYGYPLLMILLLVKIVSTMFVHCYQFFPL